MQHEIVIKDLAQIEDAARDFIAQIDDHKLIAFYAPMGAGKTTFTRAICTVLGVNSDAVSSPTFALVNEYRLPSAEPIFHFDFYRINRKEEALDIGLYDYLDSGHICLMEWPENICDLLPEETLIVKISVQDDGSRVIIWND